MKKEDCKNSLSCEESLQRVKNKLQSVEEIESICNIFRMLGEPSRLKLVLALLEGEVCVYHLTERCGGTQSGTSHQLRILKDNKVVKSRREGQNVLYSIADEHIKSILEIGALHVNCDR